MPEQYLLAERAWLPVALTSGQRAFIRLRDISRPDVVAISTGRPDCDISLTEFLIGLIAVALGPDDDDVWFDRLEKPPTAEELDAAFAPFKDALSLDGPGARFFQDREELEGEPGPISGLLIDAPGASTLRDNADHFVKRGRTDCLSRAGAAIVLATLQTSAPSGGAGHRTSLRGGGPLSTLVMPGTASKQPPTLWQKLWANVATVSPAPIKDAGKVFPWLSATRLSDKAGVSTTPENVDPAQAYFGMPRRIRLVFESNADRRPCDLLGIVDDVVATGYVTRPWGTNYVGWDNAHPLSPYYRPSPNEPTYLPVHLQSSRIGYREWLGMALGSEKSVPAKCVREFQRRAQGFRRGDEVHIRTHARLLAAGYAMDNMKPLDFGEALMPLFVGVSAEANALIRLMAEALIEAAASVAGLLTTAIKVGLYGEGAKVDGNSSVLRPARDRFWADTEQAFFERLGAAARDIDAIGKDTQNAMAAIKATHGEAWRTALQGAARRIFDDTVPLDAAEGRRIPDVVKARRMLLLALQGYGKIGGDIFKALSLVPPEQKRKKEKATP